MGHHAVERCELCIGLPPLASVISNAHAWAIANGESIRPAQSLAGPEAFGLDHRVIQEDRRLRRQAEVDRVAVILARESELQADRIRATQSLHRLRAGLHGPGKLLGTSPQGRLQSAFAGQ
jgi:hypothetical protein